MNKRIVLHYAILREMGRRKTEESYMKIVENTKVVYIRETQWPNCWGLSCWFEVQGAWIMRTHPTRKFIPSCSWWLLLTPGSTLKDCRLKNIYRYITSVVLLELDLGRATLLHFLSHMVILEAKGVANCVRWSFYITINSSFLSVWIFLYHDPVFAWRNAIVWIFKIW